MRLNQKIVANWIKRSDRLSQPYNELAFILCLFFCRLLLSAALYSTVDRCFFAARGIDFSRIGMGAQTDSSDGAAVASAGRFMQYLCDAPVPFGGCQAFNAHRTLCR